MYVSGEVAGNPPRSEPVLVPLFKTFMGIHTKFSERFDDTFWVEFKQIMTAINSERLAEAKKTNELLESWDPNVPNPPPKMESSPVTATLAEQPAPRHEPRHDVESVFWVLVCSLVRALPDGANDDPHDYAHRIFNDMLDHKIHSTSNTRDSALAWSQEEWEWSLHPKLKSLALMIVRMCGLLCINWSVRSRPSNRLLLHQGFKRLLLMQIVEIGENDIELDTERPRTVRARRPEEVRRTLVDSTFRASGDNGSEDPPTDRTQRPKRGSDSITAPGETIPPRKRPKLAHSAQVREPTPPPPPLVDSLFDGPLTPLPSSPSLPFDNLFDGPLTPSTIRGQCP